MKTRARDHSGVTQCPALNQRVASCVIYHSRTHTEINSTLRGGGEREGFCTKKLFFFQLKGNRGPNKLLQLWLLLNEKSPFGPNQPIKHSLYNSMIPKPWQRFLWGKVQLEKMSSPGMPAAVPSLSLFILRSMLRVLFSAQRGLGTSELLHFGHSCCTKNV